MWAKAIEYLLRAADKTRARFDYAQAARFCRDAIEILERHSGGSEDVGRACEALGDLESLLGDIEAANQAYDRAGEASPEPAARSRILNKRHRPGIAVRNGTRIAY